MPADPEDDLDVIELGERAAWFQLLENIYTDPEDRAWNIVARCYASVARAYGVDSAEARAWYPQLDERGMWIGMSKRT